MQLNLSAMSEIKAFKEVCNSYYKESIVRLARRRGDAAPNKTRIISAWCKLPKEERAQILTELTREDKKPEKGVVSTTDAMTAFTENPTLETFFDLTMCVTKDTEVNIRDMASREGIAVPDGKYTKNRLAKFVIVALVQKRWPGTEFKVVAQKPAAKAHCVREVLPPPTPESSGMPAYDIFGGGDHATRVRAVELDPEVRERIPMLHIDALKDFLKMENIDYYSNDLKKNLVRLVEEHLVATQRTTLEAFERMVQSHELFYIKSYDPSA
jgi:hypothetical protein